MAWARSVDAIGDLRGDLVRAARLGLADHVARGDEPAVDDLEMTLGAAPPLVNVEVIAPAPQKKLLAHPAGEGAGAGGIARERAPAGGAEGGEAPRLRLSRGLRAGAVEDGAVIEVRRRGAVLRPEVGIENARALTGEDLVAGVGRGVGDGEEIVAEWGELGRGGAEEIPEGVDLGAVDLRACGERGESEAETLDENGGVRGEKADEERAANALEERTRDRTTERFGGGRRRGRGRGRGDRGARRRTGGGERSGISGGDCIAGAKRRPRAVEAPRRRRVS